MPTRYPTDFEFWVRGLFLLSLSPGISLALEIQGGWFAGPGLGVRFMIRCMSPTCIEAMLVVSAYLLSAIILRAPSITVFYVTDEA